MHRWKFGYWFTISLLEMFLIYYTAICLTGKFFRRKGGGPEMRPSCRNYPGRSGGNALPAEIRT